jgi:hypothetical protein
MVAIGRIADVLDRAAQLRQVAEPPLERLPPTERATVLMALLGLVLVGLFLVACVMIGAHWVRRLARHRPGRERPMGDPAARASRPPPADSLELPGMLPAAGDAGATILIDSPSAETKVDP